MLGTSARGYGARHQHIRASWVPRVNAGYVDCARCGQLIQPSEAWDLGHDDNDRSAYVGPEHQSCNRSAGGREARRRERNSFSRDW